MLDPTQLRYFRAIAERGSMTAAARSLGVSQPALSQSVKSLEAHLGARLLARSARGVTLTTAGERLLDHAGRLLEALDACERDIRAIETTPIGEYVVGCHKSLGAYFLPGLLRAMSERAPSVQVALASGSSSQIRDRVLAHEVHVGVVADVAPHPNLVIVELFEDAFEVFEATSRPAPASDGEARAAVRRGPLLYAEGIPASDALLELLAAGAEVTAQPLPCGDLELVARLTGAGIGVGALPRRMVSADARVRPLHAALPRAVVTVAAIYRGDMHRTAGARILKDAVLEHGRSFPPLAV